MDESIKTTPDDQFQKDISDYIQAVALAKTIAVSLKTQKQNAAEIEQRLLDHFALNGIKRISKNGKTVYVKRRVVASAIAQEGDESGAATERAVKVLKATGFGFLIKERYSATALSGIVNEMEKSDEDPPQEFNGVIGVLEIFTLGVTKS